MWAFTYSRILPRVMFYYMFHFPNWLCLILARMPLEMDLDKVVLLSLYHRVGSPLEAVSPMQMMTSLMAIRGTLAMCGWTHFQIMIAYSALKFKFSDFDSEFGPISDKNENLQYELFFSFCKPGKKVSFLELQLNN